MAVTPAARPDRISPGRLIRPSWIAALAVLAALVFVVVRFPGPTHTLESNYTDHAHHEYAAWSFLQIGSRIWSEPLGRWEVSGPFPHRLWESVPHPYPPGTVLLFLPFGAASNLGLFPDEVVHVLLVMLLGAGALAAIVALWRALGESYPPALAAVVTALAGIELIRWGLNGFFDPLAVAVALVGIVLFQRERMGAAALVLALALSLHYRLWYLLPVAVGAAATTRRLDLRTGIASAVLGGSALPLIGLWPYLGHLPATPGFVPNPFYGELLVAVMAGALICLIAISERRAIPVLATAAAALMILFNPQWQLWYSIVFLPLLPLVRTVPAQAALTVGWVQLALIGSSAFDLRALLQQFGEALRT